MEHKRAFSEPSLLLERQRRDTGTLKALMEHKRAFSEPSLLLERQRRDTGTLKALNTICRSCSLNDSGVNKGTLKALRQRKPSATHGEWSIIVSISFDSALGIHPKALDFRSRRTEVLANNLANSETPNFKARDIRFSDTFKAYQSHIVSLNRTNQRHIKSTTGSIIGDKLYRIPIQPSIDGNTVDTQLEESNFMRNAIEFQASFTFLNSRFRGLSAAIRGD